MAALAGTVLAHQDGWDEIGLVLAPLLVFAGLLVLARRRADRLGAPHEPGAGDAAAPLRATAPRPPSDPAP